MSGPILDLRGLTVSYGKVEAVRGVDLTVRPGSIVTVIGANGAGKTSLMSAAMGLLPHGGSVAFQGADMAGVPVENRVRAGMCLVPEKRELFASMPVEDNLVLGAYTRPAAFRRQKIEEVYAIFPRLKERRRQQAGTMSGGERQMLAMGRALMSDPRLLLLDEPSLGLAPRIVQEILAIVVRLKQAGVAVLLVEQNARAALAIADHGYVMELGAVAMDGPAATLAADRRIVEMYLGLAES